MDKNDDLPAPEGPMMVKKSVDLKLPLKFFKIVLFDCL
jgi:hypothetical protein